MTSEQPHVSRRVVRAVARETGTDPLELPRLFDTIDPDALDALVREMAAGEVQFRYAGHEVTVDSHETVTVAPAPLTVGQPINSP